MLYLSQQINGYEIRTMVGMNRGGQPAGAYVVGQKPLGDGLFEFVVADISQDQINSPAPAADWSGTAATFTETATEPPIFDTAETRAWEHFMGLIDGYVHHMLKFH